MADPKEVRMALIKYIIVNIIGTLLRGLPLPCKTGLIKIGTPSRDTPVFLTCNYWLTVERVKRTLRGIDCYLLVANSKGINVWCASTGGYFTNHNVISVLKTSGIEELVNRRNVILPQLAASGIEGRIIKKKTGWNVLWGPVYAKDIPDFIKRNFKKTSGMREVKFPLIQRIEMAIMWAFPFSIIAGLISFFFWRDMVIPLVSLMWILPFLIFTSFPFYSRLLSHRKTEKFSKYTVIFDFGRVPLILWVSFILCLSVYSILTDIFTYGFILRWSFVSFVIILMISIDLMGSTPIYKSGLHEDRFLRIILDEKKCSGCGICGQVCPRNCYEMNKKRHVAIMPRANKCVQCGACIIQCPLDALCFVNPQGKIILPEIIRKFKLNLLGKRFVKMEK